MALSLSATGCGAPTSSHSQAVTLGCAPCPPAGTPTCAGGFFSGASFSLVSGGISNPAAVPGAAAPNPLMAAFSAGVVFALFQGAFFKVGCGWLAGYRGPSSCPLAKQPVERMYMYRC